MFGFIGHKNLRLHPQFWYRLALHVGSQGQTPIAADELGRWVSILLSKAVGVALDSYASIFERCVELGRLDDALDILEAVARPGIHEVSSMGDKDFGEADVRIGSDQRNLARMRSVLNDRLPEVAERLVGITTQLVALEHRQMVSWGLADHSFSQPSISRETIEGEVDRDRSTSEDVLIDLARDSLIWLAQNEPQQAEAWINRLSSSDMPFLRRLAIHAIAELQE